MARTIAVSDEVYERLKKARKPGESFSSAIKRTLEMRPKLSEIAGNRTLSPEDWEDAKRILERSQRKTVDKLLARKA